MTMETRSGKVCAAMVRLAVEEAEFPSASMDLTSKHMTRYTVPPGHHSNILQM